MMCWVLPLSAQSIRTLTLYQHFKSQFITPRGRVVDTGNNFISHSEGQGYGMLFAVHCNDRETFEKLWKWTREQLQIREEDKLFAWRWVPTPYGGFVEDKNNASDGDILIAWALLNAGRRWEHTPFLEESQKIISSIEQGLIAEKDGRLALLPGRSGFISSDGITVNLSYYVFPALADFAESDPRPDGPWKRLLRDGIALLGQAGRGKDNLPPNWLHLNATVLPSEQWPVVFGYDAARIPLHLAWHDPRHPALAPFVRFWSSEEFRNDPRPEVPLAENVEVIPHPPSRGFLALINTTGVLHMGSTWRPLLATSSQSEAGEDYYSVCLELLSQLARSANESRRLAPQGAVVR